MSELESAYRHSADWKCPTTLHVAHPLLEVKVLDTLRVEGRGASDDTMDFVALFDEELCEEGARPGPLPPVMSATLFTCLYLLVLSIRYAVGTYVLP